MVPMTWDTNYRNQEGTKGCMTIVDRKNLTVYGTYALEGINEIYPRPDESSIKSSAQTGNKSEAIYTLQGIRVDGVPATKGIYIVNGKKCVR